MLTKSIITTLTAVLALGFAAHSQTASAQPVDTVSIKVSVGDLNISSEAGAKVALERIRVAARSICGPAPSAALPRTMDYAPCVRNITDRAVASLDSPLVTALNGAPAPAKLASAR